MSSYASLRRCLSFEQALAPFHVDEDLPFANVLPVAVVEQVFAAKGPPCYLHPSRNTRSASPEGARP